MFIHNSQEGSLESNQVIFFSAGAGENTANADKLRAVGIPCVEVRSRSDAEKEIISARSAVLVYRCERLTDEAFDILKSATSGTLKTRVLVSVQDGSVEEAVQCMKAGAGDFMIGELSDTRLTESILRFLSQGEGRVPVSADMPEPEADNAEPVLIGQSHAICEIRSAVNLVAKSETTVLITGESGTGKEVISRLIHMKSSRRNNAFVALNCAAMPKDVIENELFGHERGAFTGALLKKAGCFEMADNGTLFFDEIAEMSLETQAKLLRAIETQKFRRLGGKEEVTVDVRMIAATNKNITAALHAKELREDLYYRVSVIEIFIPPLRERKEDIPLLVNYFLSLFSKKYGKPVQRFTDECAGMLREYQWPGNVREIRNVVERALVICPGPLIGAQFLPEKVKSQFPAQVQINIPMGVSTHEAERILILKTLEAVGNNKSKTAKILGLSRKTLHNKLVSYSGS